MAELCEIHCDEIRSVTITVEEYKHLVEKAQKLDLMVDAIFDEATLNYNGERLSFYSDPLDTMLKVLEHDTYTTRLHELQAKNEEE
jgi:hypothetical protein